MSSAIMRFQKAHNKIEISHIISHNTRSKEVKNADIERLELNEVVNYVDDIQEHIKALEKAHKTASGKKVRKDAVRVVEVIMTSDKEFFERVNDNEYFEECRQWLISIFGEENILQMAIHRDERTSHAHFIVTPIRENQFACKQIINGRNAVRGLQNSFHQSVEHFGLERGTLIEYSHEKHKSSLQFAEDVQKGKEHVSEMDEREKESYAIYGAMSKEEISNLQVENVGLSMENDMLKEKVEELEEEVEEISNKYEDLKEGLCSISKVSRKDAKKQIELLESQGRTIRKQTEKQAEKTLEKDVEKEREIDM